MTKYISDPWTLRVFKVEVLQELQCPSDGLTYLVHVNNRARLVASTLCISKEAFLKQEKIDNIKMTIEKLRLEIEVLDV